MSFKSYQIEKYQVKIYKRRNAKHLSIRIDKSNAVKVTIPSWTPYKVGLSFASSKKLWLDKHYHPPKILVNGQLIGKAHRLRFIESGQRIKTQISQNEIIVSFPAARSYADPNVQAAAKKACNAALKSQAERLLLIRLNELSAKHGINYRSLKIKKMKSRWGSCDQQKNITLNSQLMLLPWQLIDYVILHELTHTLVLKHDAKFWQTLNTHLPDAKIIRQKLRKFSVEPITI